MSSTKETWVKKLIETMKDLRMGPLENEFNNLDEIKKLFEEMSELFIYLEKNLVGKEKEVFLKYDNVNTVIFLKSEPFFYGKGILDLIRFIRILIRWIFGGRRTCR